jgi:hypothetical protein
MKAIFTGPTGLDVENPSTQFIKEILDQDKDFWLKGAGDAGINFEGTNNRLIFFYDEPYGFFIMYHPDYISPIVGDINNITTVYHNVGGQPMPVPSCCYISKEGAFEIIIHYLHNNGQLLNKYEWKDIYDLEFDHGFE